MAKPSPSVRFRGSALTVLAAGSLFLPVAVVAVTSLGWLEPAGPDPIEQPARAGPASPDAYGASGILPESGELNVDVVVAGGTPRGAAVPGGPLDIPPVALIAYQRAEDVLAVAAPDCGLSWNLLAGLGRVISDHGSDRLGRDGSTAGPVLGPRLNGAPGLAKIPDTDGGRLDGDRKWDRAVGPMQIIPTVWGRVGADADGNGTASPHNISDAALAAGRYLCSGGASLGNRADQARAVFDYRRSTVFVRAVLGWSQAYGLRTRLPLPSDIVAAPLPPVDDVLPLSGPPPEPGPLPPGPPSPPDSLLPPPARDVPATGGGSTPTPRDRPPPDPPTTPPDPPGTTPTTPSDSPPVPPTTTPSEPPPTTTPSEPPPTTTPSGGPTTPSDASSTDPSESEEASPESGESDVGSPEAGSTGSGSPDSSPGT